MSISILILSEVPLPEFSGNNNSGNLRGEEMKLHIYIANDLFSNVIVNFFLSKPNEILYL